MARRAVGHEVPTALMALGAPASALGRIEGITDGLAGAGRFVGGPLAGDFGRTPPPAVAATPPPPCCPR